MRIFLTTLMLFSVFMAVHFVLWKIKLPRRQIRALLMIDIGVFLPWLAVSLARHSSLLSVLHVSLYYWSVALCYVITYSAIEGDSPTLSLMRFLNSSGSRGCSQDDIRRFMDERPFIGSRLAALLNSGLVEKNDGRYVLAGKPSLFFRLILGFRKLYGPIPKGG